MSKVLGFGATLLSSLIILCVLPCHNVLKMENHIPYYKLELSIKNPEFTSVTNTGGWTVINQESQDCEYYMELR